MDAHEGKKPLDFIIALRTFIEGCNWKFAEKMYIIGNKSSLTDVLQRLGRLLRDCEGKTFVEAVHILPQPLTEDTKKNKIMQNFNNYLKTLIMVLEQLPMVFTAREKRIAKKGRVRSQFITEPSVTSHRRQRKIR